MKILAFVKIDMFGRSNSLCHWLVYPVQAISGGLVDSSFSLRTSLLLHRSWRCVHVAYIRVRLASSCQAPSH